VKTIKRRFDDRQHAVLDTRWQALTKCGLRGNWLYVKPGEPQPEEGEVDCPDCLLVLAEDEAAAKDQSEPILHLSDGRPRRVWWEQPGSDGPETQNTPPSA
jgi:hypothetical protein